MQDDRLPANRLKELREARGLERYDLSAELRVDPSTVARWETGRTPIPDHHKLTLAAFFEVTPAYLLGWDVPLEAAA